MESVSVDRSPGPGSETLPPEKWGPTIMVDITPHPAQGSTQVHSERPSVAVSVSGTVGTGVLDPLPRAPWELWCGSGSHARPQSQEREVWGTPRAFPQGCLRAVSGALGEGRQLRSPPRCLPSAGPLGARVCGAQPWRKGLVISRVSWRFPTVLRAINSRRMKKDFMDHTLPPGTPERPMCAPWLPETPEIILLFEDCTPKH